MKQYTTPKQTAKLIELGFEYYKCEIEEKSEWSYEWRKETFTIGQLLEMLPPRYKHEDLEINRDWGFGRWLVFYRGDETTAATELIDALYAMVVKLKEKGVI